MNQMVWGVMNQNMMMEMWLDSREEGEEVGW